MAPSQLRHTLHTVVTRQDGHITFDEYKKWVMSQPSVLAFFQQLSESIRQMLGKVGSNREA